MHLIASKTHLLNMETWKFVKASSIANPGVVLAPRYMVVGPYERVPYVSSYSTPTDTISLNDVNITFSDSAWMHENAWKAVISYGYAKNGYATRMSLAVEPHFREPRFGNSAARAIGFTFTDVDGSSEVSSYGVGMPAWVGTPFEHIVSLVDYRLSVSSEDKFCFGLRHIPYGCTYKGRQLSGKCFAFLAGAWAVLLADDMSFDALVLIKGATRESLNIERILHTTNPYLKKVLFLTHEG